MRVTELQAARLSVEASSFKLGLAARTHQVKEPIGDAHDRAYRFYPRSKP